MLKKRYLFLILIICLFAISAVSAEQIDNDTNIMAEDYDSSLIAESISEDTVSVSLIEDEIMGSADNGTFTALQKKINAAGEGAVINLENDYVADECWSIEINKSLTINGNGYTIDGNGECEGRILYIGSDATNVLLKNINFINRESSSVNGVGIYSESANLTIKSCNFDNISRGDSRYDGAGGAIYSSGSLNVGGCSFVNCSVYGDGGAIYSSGVLTVDDCSFESNFASSYGGAIYSSNRINISDSIFMKNDACYGRAIVAYEVYKIIDNCTFIDNYNLFRKFSFSYLQKLIDAADEGAVINLEDDYLQDYDVSAKGITIDKALTINGNGHIMDALGKAVRIFNINSQSVILNNISFINGKFYDNGGAIYSSGSLNVSGCSFEDFSPVGCGGAIYSSGSLNVNDCSFVDCYVYSGGAIFSSGSLNVDGCSFVNSEMDEVAISSYGSLNVNDCSFVDCSVAWGSAVLSDKGTFHNSNFICHSKQGDYGVAINFYNILDLSKTNIINCSFNDCYWDRAVSIYNITVNGVTLEESLFNIANDGSKLRLTKDYVFYKPLLVDANNIVIEGNGNKISENAFYIAGNNVTIKNINFENCGIVLYNVLNFNIINCSFTDSIDTTVGLDVFTSYGCKIINCSFNSLNRGIYCHDRDGCEIEIKNSTFINCYSFIYAEDYTTDIYDYIMMRNIFTISGCSFMNSSWGCEDSSAINNFMNIVGNTNIIDSIFVNCYGHSGVLVLRGNANIVHSVFVNCSSSREDSYGELKKGGAIQFYDLSTFHYPDSFVHKIINCKFINNSADIGKAVYFNNENCYLINTSFEGDDWYSDYPVDLSNVTVDGVVVSLWDSIEDYSYIYLKDDINLEYSPVKMYSNNVVIDGMGHTITSTPYWSLYMSGENVTLKNIIFNQSNICSLGKNLTIINCTFVNLSADTRGGIQFENLGKIIDCNFINCSGVYKTGICYSQHKYGDIINCNFFNCTNCIFIRLTNIINTNFMNCFGVCVREALNLMSCAFVNCTHKNGEGVVNLPYSANITKCNFTNCSAGRGGAIHYSPSVNYPHKIIISDSIFIDCYATEYGGAIYLSYSLNSIIKNCKFINNTAFIKPTAVFYADYNVPKIFNSSFVGGKWFSLGNVNTSNVLVDNELYEGIPNILEDNAVIEFSHDMCQYSASIVKGNNVVIDGKGKTISGSMNDIFCIRGSNVTIKNFIFKNCGLYSENRNNVIINCTFINSSVDDNYHGNVRGFDGVINCSFMNCHAGINNVRGGAIFKSNNIFNCSFTNCSAGGGGAIYNSNNITNCIFKKCFAENYSYYGYLSSGGAILASNNIFNCTFIECRSNPDAGAISDSSNIINCSFMNCYAPRGGAISDSSNIINCSFVDCYASNSGGAITSSGDIIYCSFVNCSAPHGGAIIGSGDIIYCSFVNCSANHGGAIIFNGNLAIINSSFMNCSARYDGGAINYDQGEDYQMINITSCNFTYCSAGEDGGAIYGDLGYVGSKFSIDRSMFINCSAGDYGGAFNFRYASSQDSITNSYFCGNDAEYYSEWWCWNIPAWGNPYPVSVYTFNNTIVKSGSYVYVPDSVFDYADSYLINATYNKAIGVIASIVDYEGAVINSDGGIIKISNLPSGNYVLNVTTIPKNNTYAVSCLSNLTINKISSSITLSNNITFYQDGSGYCNFESDGIWWINANIVDHNEAIIKIMDDKIIVSNLSPGTYILNVKTIPDKNHYSVETRCTVVCLSKKDPKINVNVDGNRITIEFPDDAGGNVNLTVGDVVFTSIIDDNKVSFDVGGISAGNYSSILYYSGDDNYNSFEKIIPISIKSNYVISAPDVTKDYGGYEPLEITLSENDEPVRDALVKIEINGTAYTFTTDSYGKIYMPLDLDAGSYDAVVSYDDVFTTAKITVNKLATETILSYTKDSYNVVSLTAEVDSTYASGTVVFNVNGEDYTAKISNGKATFTLYDLASGSYTVKATYEGDVNHKDSVSSSIRFNVGEHYVVISSPDVTKNYGGSERLLITLTNQDFEEVSDAEIMVSLAGKNYTLTTDVDGKTSLDLNLDSGNYVANIIFVGNSEYKSESAIANIIINKLTTKTTLSYTKNNYNGVTLTASVNPSTASGNVIFTVNGNNYTAKISDSKAAYELSDLDAGSYTVKTVYKGDINHKTSTSNTIEFTVPKHYAIITAPDLTKTYGGSEKLEITLTNQDSEAISNAELKIKLADKSYTKTTDVDGKVYVDLNMDSGKYTVDIVFEGNGEYAKITANSKITINEVNTETTLSLTKNSPNTVTLTAIVNPASATGDLVFAVNGKDYATKISNGKATYVLSNLDVGSYDVKSTYNGDTNHKSSLSNSVKFTVEDVKYDINAPDLTKYYHGPERFAVTVKDKANNPVAGKNVTIYLNGATYTRTTNENGEASMAINLNSGVYTVTSEFEGIEVQSTITVKSTVSGENVTKMFRNDTQYYATFVDTSGKTLAENTAVEFNINGVFYTRYTNEKGVARMNINLNPGEYVITAKNPVSEEQYTNIITVLPSIVEVHNLTKYYKNESKLTFRLLDDQGRPVGEGVAAKININGVFYERKTNASGYVNMNINLNPGTYIATLEYNGLMASSTVTVLPILEAKDVVMKYKDGTKFEAKLLDGQGNPFAGQSITFNINGVFYNRPTDENGIARLAINLMAGEYIITSMYEPNGAALSNKVTVKS